MIKSTRKKKGITQSKLSQLTGLSQGYISQLERPYFVHSPTVTQIIAISRALDLNPVTLGEYFILKELNCNKYTP